jgi:hypothetical protein
MEDLDFNFDLLDLGTNNVFVNAQEIVISCFLAFMLILTVWLIFKLFKSNKIVQKYSEKFLKAFKYSAPIRFALETYIIACLAVFL